MAEGKLHEKANDRFSPPALAAISRIFAREAALKVATESLRWITGAGGEMDTAHLPAIYAAQSELVSDMDFVADVLYNRERKSAAA
jgi:hypothetical protein